MLRKTVFCLPLLFAAASAWAGDSDQSTAPQVAAISADQSKAGGRPDKATKAQGGDVAMSGMSILGNDEAPKSLVIVPWKSSQLGDTPGISKELDDSAQPVDKEVFVRELSYYQIRSGSK